MEEEEEEKDVQLNGGGVRRVDVLDSRCGLSDLCSLTLDQLLVDLTHLLVCVRVCDLTHTSLLQAEICRNADNKPICRLAFNLFFHCEEFWESLSSSSNLRCQTRILVWFSQSFIF